MIAVGMPDQGYLEIKSEDLSERKCTVITQRGEVEIMLAVGLPQGEILSVLGCNLISAAKIAQWTTDDPKTPMPYKKGTLLHAMMRLITEMVGS